MDKRIEQTLDLALSYLGLEKPGDWMQRFDAIHVTERDIESNIRFQMSDRLHPDRQYPFRPALQARLIKLIEGMA